MAILHANVGTEVGAAVTQHLVTQFDEKYRSRISETESFVDQDGKTLENYVQLLCQLYAFKVSIINYYEPPTRGISTEYFHVFLQPDKFLSNSMGRKKYCSEKAFTFWNSTPRSSHLSKKSLRKDHLL